MSDYRGVKWVESEDGAFALEILHHPRGHARFLVYRRRYANGPGWTQVQDSGVYESPEAAEQDGMLQWQQLSKSQFSGMTTNERMSDAGLLGEWDAALRSRNRGRMIEILSEVELPDQAEWITDSALEHR